MASGNVLRRPRHHWRWICLNQTHEQHEVDLIELLSVSDPSGDGIGLHHCTRCGQYYRVTDHEMTDWNGDMTVDYYKYVFGWRPVDRNLAASIVDDPETAVPEGPFHVEETGWVQE